MTVRITDLICQSKHIGSSLPKMYSWYLLLWFTLTPICWICQFSPQINDEI